MSDDDVYTPIEDYAMIGNMLRAALISQDSCSIDWMCYPHFDSPAIFSSILDKDLGGFFRLAPSENHKHQRYKTKQLYIPDTNVLITRFLTETAMVEVTDYMPIVKDEGHHPSTTCGVEIAEPSGWLIRELKAVRGNATFTVECCPMFDFGREDHTTDILTHGARFSSDSLKMVLASTQPLDFTTHPKYSGGVCAEISLLEGTKIVFVFRESYAGLDNPFGNEKCPDTTGHPPSTVETEHFKISTLHYWRNWINKCTYRGRWREMVNRSALALKLLTFEPTGAIVAAPTCSLPEEIGGTRNWDYRFTWIRDSSFTVYALLSLGFKDEAIAFLKWIEARCAALESGQNLQIMYGIRGETFLKEEIIEHLAGYRGSKPVRTGNGAFNQKQLASMGNYWTVCTCAISIATQSLIRYGVAVNIS